MIYSDYKIKLKFLYAFSLIVTLNLSAQTQSELSKEITLDELFTEVLENNPTLKTNRYNIAISAQNTDIIKNVTLPDIFISASAVCLSDVTVLDKNFSKITTESMPHFGNSYALQVTQLLYKGGAIKNSIGIASLQETIANLRYNNDEQNIKLLVAAYYFDLKKLYNQKEVYADNIEVAEKQLENINKFYNQGMVTKNDVIRGQLQVSNFGLSLQTIESTIIIYNKQLCITAGIEEDIILLPSGSEIEQSLVFQNEKKYQETALSTHPLIKINETSIEIAQKGVDIAKSDRLPTIAAFAGGDLQRPITSSTPVLDMYSNIWQAGVSVSFDISSFYKAKKIIALNKYKLQQSEQARSATIKQISTNVQAAYTLYDLSIVQAETLKKNQELAEENYRIIQKKYNNQLALLVDLLDANNAKLQANLQYANAKIIIVHNYYKLLRETGRL